MAPIMSTKTVAISTQRRRIEAPELMGAPGSEEGWSELESGAWCGPNRPGWLGGLGGRLMRVPRLPSAALGGAPEQERHRASRHQQHAIDGAHSEVLELHVGQDLDRDGPGVIRIEDDGSYEVPEGGDERQPGAGGERRAQLRQDYAAQRPQAARPERRRRLRERP